MNRIELENRLAYLVRENWNEEAVEYLVGTLSSITTEQQLAVLIAKEEESE